MDTRSKQIWQPENLHGTSFDFDVYLDSQYAQKLSEIKLTPKQQKRMNDIGEEICKSFDYNQSSPYIFHEDTALVRQISVDGGRGTWMSLDGLFGTLPYFNRQKSLKYTTHNMDFSDDKWALLSLFEKWIFYSEVMS